jgi:hypothetical protein|tara:strand:- start:2381 stop:2938 length:558 start_codon:yes stop_codon:yes gene_type:complete
MFNKLVVYESKDIYIILDEIKNQLNLDLIFLEKKKELDEYLSDYPYDLILTKKKINNINQIILNNFPITITKLIEMINLKILKKNFSLNSNFIVGKYKLNINSKKIYYDEKTLDLTEQEIKLITYLNKKNEPIKVDRLQKDIWGYAENLETHTVETHIHRLRKKFIDIFNDRNFIISEKKGYIIK